MLHVKTPAFDSSGSWSAKRSGIPRAALVAAAFAFVAISARPLGAEVPRTEIPPKPEGWELRGEAAKGEETFQKSCGLCHGADGSGKGRLQLDPPARDLRDPKARKLGDGDWPAFVVVRDGGEAVGLSKRMLAYGKLLDEQELHDVVAWVQSLLQRDEN